jgi:hypothetical protein
MKKFLLTFSLLSSAYWLFAQSVAQMQFINNAPDKAIDIYIDDQLVVNDLIFRQATTYLFVPSGKVAVKIAPSTSRSAAEAYRTFTLNLANLEGYIGMIGGKSAEQAELFLYTGASPFAVTQSTIGVGFANGALDVPSMDFVTLGFPLFSNIQFGEYGATVSVPAIDFEIQLTETNDSDVVYIANKFNFSFWKGRSALIFSSGYADGRYPALKTYVTLSNGATFPLEEIMVTDETRFAKVQLVHNAARENLDIYLNGTLWQDNLIFRQATGFINFPAEQEMEIGIAPRNSTSSEDIVQVFRVIVEKNSNNVLLFNGVALDEIDITLSIKENAKLGAQDNSSVALAFANGSASIPDLDIWIDGTRQFSPVLFGETKSYKDFSALRTLNLELTSGQICRSYKVDFNFWKGKSAFLFTSDSGTDFQLRVILSNGASFPLIETAHTEHQQTAQDKQIDWQIAANELLLHKKDSWDEPLKVSIVHVNGQVLRTITFETQSAMHSIALDGLPIGIYFVQLSAKTWQETKKIFWTPQ